MNIVSSCQGNNLTIFLRLIELLEGERNVDKIGIYVSDSMAFDKQIQPKLQNKNVTVLKEWEIFNKGKDLAPNWEKIRDFEQRIGDPVLWNVILSDRRVFFGRKCKMQQDYKSRFSYHEMAGILQESLIYVEKHFNDIKPDLVISFGTSNVGDYLFYLFAKANKIPFLQLKATKISNRVSFNDDIITLSDHVKKVFDNDISFHTQITREAKEYLGQVEKTGAKCEGAILLKRKIDLLKTAFIIAKGAYASLRRKVNPIYRSDNHLEPHFSLQLYEKIFNPTKYFYQSFVLRNELLSYEQLGKQERFVFFPLHFEPEVSMQVVGRPYQNQIELVRNIALNLPAGMKVIVKEHPRSKGFRGLSYYRKLLEIPNVSLVKTEVPTNLVVKKSSMVAVISGSTGLEAAIIGRPVITFGVPVYNVLPNNMVRHITDLNNLSWEIKDLFKHYKKDDEKLEKYICAVIKGSVPVDLYTVLLGKSDRFNASGHIDDKGKREVEEYDALSSYFNLRINEELENVKK